MTGRCGIIKVVDGRYKRLLVSYNVEADERANASVAIPLKLRDRAPAVVTLHGTHPQGMRMEAGLIPNAQGLHDQAYLDQAARRGFVAIAGTSTSNRCGRACWRGSCRRSTSTRSSP
jgi:hypothetical protein